MPNQSDQRANEIISSLAGYPDAGVNKDVASDGEGLFDQPDSIIEDEIHTDLDAIPSGIVDEQADIIEKVESEGKKESKGEAKEEDTVEYWKKAAGGRLQDTLKTREQLREQGAHIESLRQMWLADAKEKQAKADEARKVSELQAEQTLYGEEVVNDPAARYLRDKMQQTQEMIERNRQYEEYQKRQVQEQSAQYERQVNAQNVALDTLDTLEADMAKEHPDYYDAYKYAVEKRADMYETRGYTRADAEMAVRNEEAYLFAEQMQMGGNPAKVAYKMALDWGWTAPEVEADGKPDVGKLAASIGSQGVGGMAGSNSHASDAKWMTQKEFFDTVPENVRIAVLGDSDKFEELGRTGKIKIDW